MKRRVALARDPAGNSTLSGFMMARRGRRGRSPATLAALAARHNARPSRAEPSSPAAAKDNEGLDPCAANPGAGCELLGAPIVQRQWP